MTLNLLDTALLKTALDAENSFFYYLKNDTTTVSNEHYTDIRNKFIAWAEAYANDDLYITTGNGTTKLEGIDSITPPPAR